MRRFVATVAGLIIGSYLLLHITSNRAVLTACTFAGGSILLQAIQELRKEHNVSLVNLLDRTQDAVNKGQEDAVVALQTRKTSLGTWLAKNYEIGTRRRTDDN